MNFNFFILPYLFKYLLYNKASTAHFVSDFNGLKFSPNIFLSVNVKFSKNSSNFNLSIFLFIGLTFFIFGITTFLISFTACTVFTCTVFTFIFFESFNKLFAFIFIIICFFNIISNLSNLLFIYSSSASPSINIFILSNSALFDIVILFDLSVSFIALSNNSYLSK